MTSAKLLGCCSGNTGRALPCKRPGRRLSACTECGLRRRYFRLHHKEPRTDERDLDLVPPGDDAKCRTFWTFRVYRVRSLVLPQMPSTRLRHSAKLCVLLVSRWDRKRQDP